MTFLSPNQPARSSFHSVEESDGCAASHSRGRGPCDVIGLLISVRSVAEFDAIVGLGVDVIDFKEPRQGPLAPASPALWQHAEQQRRSVSGSHLSAALGEHAGAAELAPLVPACFRYAKAGPAGAASPRQLAQQWRSIGSELPPTVELVAVGYADHRSAACPDPESIFAAAADEGIKTWLIDTFTKTAGHDVLHWIDAAGLDRIANMAKSSGARWVLAGSIRLPIATALIQQGICPDLFGVRGDVCEGSRRGRLMVDRVGDWLDVLRSPAKQQNHEHNRERSRDQAKVR